MPRTVAISQPNPAPRNRTRHACSDPCRFMRSRRSAHPQSTPSAIHHSFQFSPGCPSSRSTASPRPRTGWSVAGPPAGNARGICAGKRAAFSFNLLSSYWPRPVVRPGRCPRSPSHAQLQAFRIIFPPLYCGRKIQFRSSSSVSTAYVVAIIWFPSSQARLLEFRQLPSGRCILESRLRSSRDQLCGWP